MSLLSALYRQQTPFKLRIHYTSRDQLGHSPGSWYYSAASDYNLERDMEGSHGLIKIVDKQPPPRIGHIFE
jgi:hypothetical protein